MANTANYAIIVAGGKGIRMGGDIPKQFICVDGRPVLMRTLDAFYKYDNKLKLILVLPQSQQAFWQDLCARHQFAIPYQLANGGETRFESVQNGLALIPNSSTGVVGVHDGVRPFPSDEVISNCYAEAERHTLGLAIL